jgi:hypothetical protein
MTLAHQHLAQLDSQIRDAILGNVSSLICFRTGATDARILESEFSPEFKKDDFVYLPAYQMAARLLVKSEVALAFTAEALQLSKLPNSGE